LGIPQVPDSDVSYQITRPRYTSRHPLSGKRLRMHATFRSSQLFRSEVIGATEGIAFHDVTLVFQPISQGSSADERSAT